MSFSEHRLPLLRIMLSRKEAPARGSPELLAETRCRQDGINAALGSWRGWCLSACDAHAASSDRRASAHFSTDLV